MEIILNTFGSSLNWDNGGFVVTNQAGRKRIFVTFHPMREEDATVCDQRGIPRFTMSEIKAAQQAFFRRLNEYMTTINAR